MLDGLVLAALFSAVLIVRRRLVARTAAWVIAGAAAFLVLLAVEQHCATGVWLHPTQTTYFERSDWPPNCHRLGFGVDVGCTIEHRGWVARFGPDGYGLREALGVVRDQATAFGEDVAGFGPLLLFAFVPLVFLGSAPDAAPASFLLALTLAYGLFYFGASEFLGARHLFPAAPMAWLLIARGAVALPSRAQGWFNVGHARAAGLVVVIGVTTAAAWGPWHGRAVVATERQSARSDLRATLAKNGDRGILTSRDEQAVAAATDPWTDGDRRFFVLDDGSGLVELRRAHRDLPFFRSLPRDAIEKVVTSAPTPGVLVELERTWPSLVIPSGLGAAPAHRAGASGGAVLVLAHAGPGASAILPFDVALDGDPLPDWHGYAPKTEALQGPWMSRELGSGRHVLIARCTGHDAASQGYEAELDAFVGEPDASDTGH